MRLLFTNVGRRTYMVEFALALKARGLLEAVYVGDCARDVAGLHVSDQAIPVMLPMIADGEDRFAEAVFDRCRENGIGLAIPLSDFELAALSKSKPRFAAAGIRAVVADPEAIEAAMDKRETFAFCRRHGLPTPASWFMPSEFPGPYPCIRKRIRGSASVGLSEVVDAGGLAGFIPGTDMIQEKIAGVEYGIDILNDFSGRFVAACVKRKLAMRAGETDKARIVDHPGLQELARRISDCFRHVGNLDVDVLEDRAGNLYCIDFNPRFGGGYPATHLAGFDYLEAIVAMAGGEKPRLPAHPKPMVVLKGISLHAYEEER